MSPLLIMTTKGRGSYFYICIGCIEPEIVSRSVTKVVLHGKTLRS